MLNKNTIEFLGIWEELHNSGFNRVQFEAIKNGADTLNLVLAGKSADHPARIPDCNTIFRDRARDNTPGPDDTVPANGHAGKKDRAAADPYAIFDRNRFGECPEESCSFFFPVSNEPLLRQYRMAGGIDLHIGCDQYLIADMDWAIVYKCTVYIDDHIVSDKNIFSMIAVEWRINFYIFPNSTE